MALWGGRFSKSTAELLSEFSQSISFDQRLYAHDIRGSIAHVKMLAATRIIPEGDAEAIIGELQCIEEDITSGRFEFKTELEDIHMNIEKALIDRLGEAGARVHSARSRNDQVATDIRLYLRDEIDTISTMIRRLMRTLVDLAGRNDSAILPGFTHLQHAQPVLFAHHLLAYVEMFARDVERLRDCRKRMNLCPLGSGALAGTTLPIDREQVARNLQFDGVARNSMDAVADRDFIIEILAALSIFMMHMSRLSEDIILWMSQEFHFVVLDDRYCTGSSLMPQKKNPDISELTRGKTGRVYGDLIALLTVMKGLPLTYNRDLQEDKEPLFDAVDTVKMVLAVYDPMLQSMQTNADAMATASADSMLMATDLAEWLVSVGVPFRTAHEKVGRLVAFCQSRTGDLRDLSLADIQDVIPEATAECLGLFTAEHSVGIRNSLGGTSPSQVASQLRHWKCELDVDE